MDTTSNYFTFETFTFGEHGNSVLYDVAIVGDEIPTGRKWAAVAAASARPHYLVCNADESEPGTFKDRVLLEWDPFAIVEAMTIPAFATGCERGYLYIRGEYPVAEMRMRHAVDEARADGLLGSSILGSGWSFDVEIRRGAGAYICGEETALFNSIEGGRGEPRNKPPFPVEVGLFGKPTLINNVETLDNVLDLVTGGGPAFAGQGTAGSTGTKLFCLAGHVARPGISHHHAVRALAARARPARALRPARRGPARDPTDPHRDHRAAPGGLSPVPHRRGRRGDPPRQRPRHVLRPLVVPMALAADGLDERAEDRSEARLAEVDHIKATAAASENYANFYGQNLFFGAPGVALVVKNLADHGYVISALQVSLYSIPIAITALVLGTTQYLLLDRWLRRKHAEHRISRAREEESP